MYIHFQIYSKGGEKMKKSKKKKQDTSNKKQTASIKNTDAEKIADIIISQLRKERETQQRKAAEILSKSSPLHHWKH